MYLIWTQVTDMTWCGGLNGMSPISTDALIPGPQFVELFGDVQDMLPCWRMCSFRLSEFPVHTLLPACNVHTYICEL